MARLLPSLLLGLMGSAAASQCPSDACLRAISKGGGLAQCNSHLVATGTNPNKKTATVTGPPSTVWSPVTVTNPYWTSTVANSTHNWVSPTTIPGTLHLPTDSTKTICEIGTEVDYLSTTMSTSYTTYKVPPTILPGGSSFSLVTTVPAYATACGDWSHYSQQCSCIGATIDYTVVTAPVPTLTLCSTITATNSSTTTTVSATMTVSTSTSTSVPLTMSVYSFLTTTNRLTHTWTSTHTWDVTTTTKPQTLTSVITKTVTTSK